MKQTSKILSFFAFPVLVFLIHLIIVGISNLYALFPYIDIPFHYAGGLAIAFTSAQILLYLEEEKITPVLNRVLFLIVIMTLTTTAAVVWEFGEFISDTLWQWELLPRKSCDAGSDGCLPPALQTWILVHSTWGGCEHRLR
jgi:hypothetical protein